MKRSKRQSQIIEKLLVCSECGSGRIIPRRKSHNRPTDHHKHMWCLVCRRKTRHVEAGFI